MYNILFRRLFQNAILKKLLKSSLQCYRKQTAWMFLWLTVYWREAGVLTAKGDKTRAQSSAPVTAASDCVRRYELRS